MTHEVDVKYGMVADHVLGSACPEDELAAVTWAVRIPMIGWTLSASLLAVLAVSTVADGAELEPVSAGPSEEGEVADSAVRWLLLRRRTWRELPEAPRAPTVTGDSPYSLAVAWDPPDRPPTAVVGYDVEYRVATASAFSQWPHSGAATTTAITGLSPSTTHHVRVRAINDAGRGDWSEAGIGMTSHVPVFSEGASTTRAVLENTPAHRNIGSPVAAAHAANETLTYGLGGPDAWRFGIVAGSGQLRTLGEVDYDHEENPDHEVTVTAEDTRGGRAAIVVHIRVLDVVESPGRPAAPIVVASSRTSVRVSWTAPANTGPPITDYDYRYRVATSNRRWTEVTDTAIAATRTEITGLVGGVRYEVQVRASSDEGVSDWSESGSIGAPNDAPVVDLGKLRDVDVTVGGAIEVVPLNQAFSDPEGYPLTFSVSSTDEAIAVAKPEGPVATVEAVAPGTVDIAVIATDPLGATVSADFKVRAHAATRAAPILRYTRTSRLLRVEFTDSFAAREVRAYRFRIRQGLPRGAWRRYCVTITSKYDEPGSIRIEFTLPIDSFLVPGTTYELDYRYMGGASCGVDSVPGPWSRVARLTTPWAGRGNFDIELAFVGGEPSAHHKALIEQAAETWEAIITNELPDHDFANDPIPAGACLEGQPEFAGIVDDLRIYVRLASIDGRHGTLGTAGLCYYRTPSGFPIVSEIELDTDDLDGLSDAVVRGLMLHEIAHALGFGILWGHKGLLENPSLVDGAPVSPPPDTHFSGSNAVAAFDSAGGTNYKAGRVPVENRFGGSGSQDSHWRKSVMGSELMTRSLGRVYSLSAITIESMADLGYSVDASQADAYTVPNVQGDVLRSLDAVGALALPNCVVRLPTDAIAVLEPVAEVRSMSGRDTEVDIQIEAE
ncbi:MAG: hypothetical protein F4X98_19800 [Gammaproteobacteria bacterium]|nr:hypothetical protein [Gammaproteobacteria bacterium]